MQRADFYIYCRKNKLINYNTGDVVTSGLLDKDGNMWFTINKDGIYKYDGKIFKNFTIKEGLCSNEVWSVIQDKDGLLWFGTNKGLCTFDPSATLKA